MKTPLAGQVLWLTTRADIQKNTLQVKVAINDPPQVITPEMLGQVTFLAAPQPVSAETAGEDPLRLLVPRSLVAAEEGGASIWVANPERGIAERRSVEVGRAGTDQLVEITSGLDPTSKLIVGGRESLAPGMRIRITGEDRSLTANSNNPTSNSPTSASARSTATAVE
jgi:multidrug efflux pump subunit AcrA (membrane-fusion protein)